MNNNYKKITAKETDKNFFTAIGKEWMLISADKNDGSNNMMTASWGGIGVFWGKDICFCGIRPQRYTFEFAEEAEHIALCFFKEEHRRVLEICGAKSGRDIDKAAETGLTPIKLGNITGYEQAYMIIEAKKLYVDDLKKGCFIDKTLTSKFYADNDYHRIYVCEIENIYIKD